MAMDARLETEGYCHPMDRIELSLNILTSEIHTSEMYEQCHIFLNYCQQQSFMSKSQAKELLSSARQALRKK